ncbi:helix-turn-helix domain-containing protein [Ornithobacterium rhinotracheale]
MYRIKEIAKSKGIQMNEIAEKIGVKPNTLSRINSGDSTTIATLEAIANILEVKVKDLFVESSTIHLIINDESYTFYSVEELKEFIQKKIDE